MAHVKISQMPALVGALDNDDVFTLVRGSANYRVTFNQIRATIDSGEGGGGTVSSVNSKIGDVVLTAADVNALPASTTYVESVNGQSGIVSLDADDVGALPGNTTYVESVNGHSGIVSLDADDVGALPASTTYVASVAAGTNITIDDTDPSAPIVSADVGVTSVQGHTGAVVIGLKEVTDEYDLQGTLAPMQALAIYKELDWAGKLLQTTEDADGNPIAVSGLSTAQYQTAGVPESGTVPTHGTGGRLRVGTPVNDTDATTKAYVDGRLSAAQRSAIDLLDGSSTAADIVAALQAT